MATTPTIGATLLVTGQANQETSYNDSINLLDGTAHSYSVISRTTAAEPGSPTDGDWYLLPASPTGTNWSGNANKLAGYYNGWVFVTRQKGFRIFVQDEGYGRALTWDGTVWAGQQEIISITLSAPGASEDRSLTFTEWPITIDEIRAVLIGSSTPSITWTIRHGTDRSAAGTEVVTGGTTTTSTTTGSDVTTFNAAAIAADSFVWIETTAQSGIVDELHVSIIGRRA